MDGMIRQVIQQEANRCPVQSIPWDNICNRALDNVISNTSLQHNTIIRKIGYGFAAAVIISGLLVASGFISPVIARTVERIPVVKSVFDFYGAKWGLQTTLNKEFSTTLKTTATDKDISVTITDVLYDKGRLIIGYTVMTSRPDLYLRHMPSYFIPLPIALGSPGMQFFINGKAIHDTANGTCEKMGNGNVGIVDIYPHGDLPERFNLQIAIHQIGTQQGEWLFTVPVSRQSTDAATRTFLPMKEWTIGQTTVITKMVQICPTDIVINYETMQPVSSHFSLDNLPYRIIDDTGRSYLGPGLDSIVSEQVEGNTEIRMLRSVMDASLKSMPKYLVFVYPTQTVKVFLKN